ncbi:MAG: twin-arginine translocation signal domain-containing protein [Vulcanimicrobiota bacterium]
MSISRRDFLKVSFFSAAAAAMTACGRPVEHGVVSQFQMPEYTLPGDPLYWASCCTELRSDCPVSVKTVENRAIHVMGLPGNFLTHGKVDTVSITSLQALYHPERLIDHFKGSNTTDGDSVLKDLSRQLGNAGKDNALWIVDRLCGTRGGIILRAAAATGAKIWVLDVPSSMQERRVIKALTGQARLPFYALEKADFLVTFGGDFLHRGYNSTRSSWAYGQFRKGKRRQRGKMVSVSSRISATDACADRWIGVRPGTEAWIALGVGNLLAEQGKGKGSWPGWARSVTMADVVAATGVELDIIEKLAARLGEARSPLVVAGDGLGDHGAASLYIVHALNQLLRGKIDTFEPDLVPGAAPAAADVFVNSEEAVKMLDTAKTVWIFDCNPVYLMPSLAEKIKNARSSVAFTTFANDTTEHCKMMVAIRHWMEEWADLRVSSPDGEFYGLTQPVIKPLYERTWSLTEALIRAANEAGVDVGTKETRMRKVLQGDRDNQSWEAMLVRGGVWKDVGQDIYRGHVNHPPQATPDPGNPPAGYSPFENLEAVQVNGWHAAPPPGMVFVPFLTNLADGSLANRPWMQELPDSMTTVVWDSWVELNEDRAKELGLARHDVVQVKVGDKSFEASVYPNPALHPEVVAMPVGRGHKNYGRWTGVGYNPLQALDANWQPDSGEAHWLATGVQVTKTARKSRLTTFDQRVYNLQRHILPE